MKTFKVILFTFVLIFSTNAVSQTVYVTKTGSKYHKTNCRFLKYSKKEISLIRAKTLGYEQCSICKPTTNNTNKHTTSSKASTRNNNDKPVIKKAKASQCIGRTKSGSRCKRSTKNTSGRCYQH